MLHNYHTTFLQSYPWVGGGCLTKCLSVRSGYVFFKEWHLVFNNNDILTSRPPTNQILNDNLSILFPVFSPFKEFRTDVFRNIQNNFIYHLIIPFSIRYHYGSQLHPCFDYNVTCKWELRFLCLCLSQSWCHEVICGHHSFIIPPDYRNKVRMLCYQFFLQSFSFTFWEYFYS